MAPPVTRLTLAYGAGLWTGLTFLLPHALLWCLVPPAIAGVLGRRFAGVLVAAFALGTLAGTLRAVQREAHCSAVWRPGAQAATLRLHDAAGPRGTTTADVRHAAEGCRGTLRLRLGELRPPAGARVVAVGAYRPGGVLRVAHLRVLEAPRGWRYPMREALARRLRGLYGRRAGLVEAMVIGRREDLPPSLRNTFAAAGLAHLLAISGLHVGLLAGWLVLLLRRVASPGKAWVLSAAASWGYVALLGFPAPATRAAGFLTLHAAARLRQRHPPRSAVLAVAVFAVMLIEPAAVTAVGAWLSVAAVWGTGAAAAWLPAARRRHPAWRLAAASAGATLATAPITAFAFGTVAPAGVAANLVAVPLAGVAVPGVIASLAAGELVAGGAGLVLAAIERVAGAAAALPLGNVTGRSGLGFAVPWTALSVAVFWAAGRRGRPRSLVRRLPALAATASWLLVALAAADRRDGEGSLTLHVLDVGQGDAIAMRTPRGRWVLVDAGPRSAAGDAGRAVVVPFLRRQGVQRLAVLVVSHGDADHLGGAPAVLRQLDPELVLEPGQPLGTRLYLEYLAALDAGGVPWRAARAGDTLVIDSVVVAVLHPTARWLERRVEPNENSVVLRVSYGCFDAVLTGDIGEPAERVLLQSVGQSEVLKVGHHGSAGSTTPEWLDAVAPAAAVISVGRNAYGHPAATVLRRLAGRGTAVWRTDRGGAVTIETDGRYLTIIQGQATTLWEGIRCRIRQLSRLSGSFSSRSGCTRRPPVSLPSCSTTSR